jgi:hypothetical protein
MRLARVGIALVAAMLALGGVARATIRYGNVQLSGNLQAQLIFRTPSPTEWHWIQERNTFRLQYEHELVERGRLAERFDVPGIEALDLFGYYRFVYDSIYDIEPGGRLENQDGSRGGTFAEFSGDEAKFENDVRELFVDVQLAGLPISLRIGKQQISWGEALISRSLDSVNALDVSWHLFYEAGLFGKVGFDELRIPAWTIKALWDLGSIGPFSNAFLEAYDIPFDFNPTEVKTTDEAPWALPFRDPFRGGLAVDLGAQAGLPEGVGLLQPCFDLTGNEQTNAEAGVVFDDEVNRSGVCNSPGRRVTTYRQGAYDRRDPRDVNQFGARFSAVAPGGFQFSLVYMYRRSLGADVPGTGIGKFQSGRVLGNPAGYVAVAPHVTFDESRRVATPVLGYLRIPAEVYYPYVNVFGASGVYADDWTGAVFNAEGTFTKDLPVFNANAFGNGIEKRNVILGSVGVDRPVWVRTLNRRSTFQAFAQLNVNYVLGHEDVRFGPGAIPLPGAPEVPISGDVGIPNSDLIPGAYIDSNDVDELKQVEMISLVGFATFYRGGSLNPVVFWLSDWTNAPAMAWFFLVDWYVTNDWIVTPRLNVFSTFGRPNVNDAFAIGRSGGAGNRSEVQLRVTYQF